MASVVPRKNKDGAVTSYQVKWRINGDWQIERFTDEDSAKVFKQAVDDAGQRWPAGWVKGKGFIDPQAEEPDETRYRFREYALAYIERKTGIEKHYRNALRRDLERWIFPTFGECDVRSTVHFNSDTVADWVRMLEQARVFSGQRPKVGEPKWRPMSPKTIKNLHGLLSEIMERAVRAEPPLRERNPCALTKLGRTDDDGADDFGEDIAFMTPDEIDAIVQNLTRRSDQLLVTIAYGTGMRWGELTALAPASLVDWKTSAPKIRVMRAWKRDGEGGYYLGKPKSKKSRRTLRVSPAVVAAVEELGGFDEDNALRLYFTGDQGQRLHYSSFHDRWKRAVVRAKANGLFPKHKNPTPHDTRHSHAAALLSAGKGLHYVKERLGHESIKTTSDTYGHLLPEADDDAMDVIEASLNRRSPAGSETPAVPVDEKVDRNLVHVVLLDDGHAEPFWARSDAAAVAEQWQLDHPGEGARVETWSADWWRRQQTNGLKGVRGGLPQRVMVWRGSALYLPDGSQMSTGADVEQVAARWLWEWEEQFTREPAVTRVAHEPGKAALTRAEAWGVDREKVAAAFAEARQEALRTCGEHPARVVA